MAKLKTLIQDDNRHSSDPDRGLGGILMLRQLTAAPGPGGSSKLLCNPYRGPRAAHGPPRQSFDFHDVKLYMIIISPCIIYSLAKSIGIPSAPESVHSFLWNCDGAFKRNMKHTLCCT
jgi:hypothetical protein